MPSNLESLDIKWLTQVVELSFEFGPFLFAILFLFVVTRLAHKMYQGVLTRTDPPASKAERVTYRSYLIASFTVGIGLVLLSVGWWIYAQPSQYVFTGVIVDLKETEAVTSSELFFRKVIRPKPIPEAPDRHDEYFVLVRNAPFAEGMVFELDFWKGVGGSSEPRVLRLPYSEGDGAKYRITYREEDDAHVLEQVAEASGGWPTLSAFAAEVQKAPSKSQIFEQLYIQRSITPKEVPQPVENKKGLCLHPAFNVFVACDTVKKDDASRNEPEVIELQIGVLQDERSDIGSKIAAADVLLAVERERLANAASQSRDAEPFLLTLYDLGRHTDGELAAKSRKLLSRVDGPDLLARQVVSDDAGARDEAHMVLLRLEPEQAIDVLSRPPAAERIDPELQKLRDVVRSGTASQALKPSASAQGDRYYVKAIWNPANAAETECLTSLFNARLERKRSLEDERVLMAGRSERIVYWYSKSWALDMAREIADCGGTVEFVRY